MCQIHTYAIDRLCDLFIGATLTQPADFQQQAQHFEHSHVAVLCEKKKTHTPGCHYRAGRLNPGVSNGAEGEQAKLTHLGHLGQSPGSQQCC